MTTGSGTTRTAGRRTALPDGGELLDATTQTVLKLNETGLRLSGRMMTIALEGTAGHVDDMMRLCERLLACRTPVEIVEAQLAYANATFERLNKEISAVIAAESAELAEVAAEAERLEPQRPPRSREAA